MRGAAAHPGRVRAAAAVAGVAAGALVAAGAGWAGSGMAEARPEVAMVGGPAATAPRPPLPEAPELGAGAAGPEPERPSAPPAPTGTGVEPPGEPGGRTLAPGAVYGWPLHPAPTVRAPFREPAHRYGPGHRGVDLGALPGQPVLAARAGTVVFAGPLAGRGVVSVQHDDGLRTTYEPVNPLVAAGAVVRRGDPIGALDAGHPGCPDPACLHWGARRGDAEYLDPLVLVRPARIRLLPVPEPWPGDPG